jgi:hypothetical protein
MAEFLEGSKLNAAIEDLISNAYEQIILMSPYVKFHARIKDELSKHKKNPSILIRLVFGKNKDDFSKSINVSDLDFLMDFPHISIFHNDRLHAKIYCNENDSILSSMNLYDFSQNNNLEFGVKSSYKLLGNSMEGRINEFIDKVIQGSELVFEKKPEFNKEMLGLSKKYTGSKITIDKLSVLLGKAKEKTPLTGPKFTPPQRPTPTNQNSSLNGFCIRTGKQIPLNAEQPFSAESLASWKRFGDENYAEKFCHFSGEPSNGETCKARPILKKNWSAYKKAIDQKH